MTRFVRLLVWTVAVLGVLFVVTWWVLLSPLGADGDTVFGCVDEPQYQCITDEGNWVALERTSAPSVGLIVYPGARVVPEAYVPVAEQLLSADVSVFVVRMPLNFAIFDADAADAVIDSHPEITHWVIAGHSLGGAMAARFAAQDDRVEGLVLWAAYPESSLDLSESDLAVASISASEDGLATPDEIEESRSRLPADAVFTVIGGGNHAQFGDYGEQRGDNPASISAEEQWRQIAGATGDLLWHVATEGTSGRPNSLATDNPG
jgi:dienelactone hydrolase